jgi:hypothetical protein
MKVSYRRLAAVVLLLFSLLSWSYSALAATGPALTVDASPVTHHAISPFIYGMNFADESLAKELKLPVRRWGGNATTRYNWQNDLANHASDFYFENIVEGDSGTLPNGSTADLFVDQDRRTGTKSLITVPLIGWTTNGIEKACGFGVKKYGAQQDTDIYAPDCGNGIRPDGSLITGNDPLDTSIAIGPSFVTGWINHLISRYGTAANGGVMFYSLDNEPDLWHETHRDVHPNGATYDELRNQAYSIGAAIKAADPTALTLGPDGFSYLSLKITGSDLQTCDQVGDNCWSNPPDQAAHGGTPFGAWYLQQMAAYQAVHGVRILDYFDNHLYPQANGVGSDQTDAATNALRLRSTRQFWDPTYVDESWINEPIYYIPRVKALIAANYPDTKIAITEYNWGAVGDINGALAQADILGIFGREGLDLATMWDPPTPVQAAAYAFRMYRNYDGAGSMFGDTGISASSADQGQLAVYGALRTSDGALTLIVINKTGNDLTSNLSLTGFSGANTAQVYNYSAANLNAIVKKPDLAVGVGGFSTTYPANSITLIVLAQNGAATNTPTVTASATNTSTPTDTSTATLTSTPTDTAQVSATPTQTPSSTSTNTPTSTFTFTPTFTSTPRPSDTPVPTATPVPSITPVVITPETLRNQLTLCGATDKGILNSLMVKIDHGQWGAFINEVQAQYGKKIDPACADQLISIAKSLGG